ncbi:MAG: preprotein translocase subunit SecG [Candidatus Gribaldobacteria bacterium]|nr:preprotein translocase subunit SecG [Candidatus Gribaldobacteria bacterium]
MNNILLIIQIVICALIIPAILLQRRGTAMGSAFGGGGEMYLQRRGLDKKLFWATIVLSILFLAISYLNISL